MRQQRSIRPHFVLGIYLFLISFMMTSLSEAQFSEENLQALVVESQKSSEECHNYQKEVDEVLGRRVEGKKGFFWRDPADLNEALRLLGESPEIPPASRQLAEKMAEETLSDIDPVQFVFEILPSVESCSKGTLGFYRLFNALTENSGGLSPDASQQNQIRDTLLAWIRRESRHPEPVSLLAVLVQVSMLERARDHGLLELRPKQNALLNRILEETRSTREDLVEGRGKDLQRQILELHKKQASPRDMARVQLEALTYEMQETRLLWQLVRQLLVQI